jgi:membrane protein implicated in regulation of membrane protease activity
VTVLVALLLAVFVLPYPWGIVAVAGALVVEVGEAWFWIWLSKRRRSVVGAEALVGASAVVVTPCRPAGQVRVAGELWGALCEAGADAGDVVRIDRVDGLTLVVTPEAAAAAR